MLNLIIKKDSNEIMKCYQHNVSYETQLKNVISTFGGEPKDYVYAEMDKDETKKFSLALQFNKKIKHKNGVIFIDDVSEEEILAKKEVENKKILRKAKIEAQKELNAIIELEKVDINEDYSIEKAKLESIINGI